MCLLWSALPVFDISYVYSCVYVVVYVCVCVCVCVLALELFWVSISFFVKVWILGCTFGCVKSFAIFWNVRTRDLYITWPNQFDTWKISAVFINIMAVDRLIRSTLRKQLKTCTLLKKKAYLIAVNEPDGLMNFPRVARNSMIRPENRWFVIVLKTINIHAVNNSRVLSVELDISVQCGSSYSGNGYTRFP